MDNSLTTLHSVSLNSECGGQLFYYVSDLHLEYQLLLAEKSLTLDSALFSTTAF